MGRNGKLWVMEQLEPIMNEMNEMKGMLNALFEENARLKEKIAEMEKPPTPAPTFDLLSFDEPPSPEPEPEPEPSLREKMLEATMARMTKKNPPRQCKTQYTYGERRNEQIRQDWLN